MNMKKGLFILLVSLFIIPFGYGQVRKKVIISESSSVFKCDKGTKWSSIPSIMRLDVCKYYGVKDCRTDLQKKYYVQTPEGQKLLNELKLKKNEVMNTKTYYIQDLYKYFTEYNLKTKTLDIEYSDLEDECSLMNGYVDLNGVSVKVNPVIRYSWKKGPQIGVLVGHKINKYLKIPIKDERIALDIENNIGNMAMLFEFNIRNVKKFEHSVTTDDILIGGYATVYLIDKNTYEIYFQL